MLHSVYFVVRNQESAFQNHIKFLFYHRQNRYSHHTYKYVLACVYIRKHIYIHYYLPGRKNIPLFIADGKVNSSNPYGNQYVGVSTKQQDYHMIQIYSSQVCTARIQLGHSRDICLPMFIHNCFVVESTQVRTVNERIRKT